MSASPRISLILPAYREGSHLAESLSVIRQALEPLESYEVIVVDDGSPDDTWDVLCRILENWPALRAIRLSRNFGKEAAVKAGLAQSQGDAVIVMDADLQHPPALLLQMVHLWANEGYDVVNAVKRRREPEGRVKQRLTHLYYRLFSALSGIDVGNASDFKLLSRRAAECIIHLPERRSFFRGLVAWMGFRQTAIEFDVPPRNAGESSWSLWKLAVLAFDSILAFTPLPLHIMTILGMVFGAIAVILTVRTLWLWIMGDAVPGFTTVILLLILIGAILMIGLGVIGAYIAKIYEEVKRRPSFIIAEERRAEPLHPPADDRHQKGQTAWEAAKDL